MNYGHYPIFPTLVSCFDLSDHPALPSVVDIIENGDHSLRPHGLLNNGLSSIGNTDFLASAELKDIKSAIQDAVNIYTQEAGLESCTVAHSWFNILHSGHEVKPHRHEGSVVSGAFYPFVEEGSVGLNFESPLKPVKMNDIAEKQTQYTSYTSTIQVKSGLLIIFPSWLIHYTEQNQTSKRFTISFNTIRNSLRDNIIKLSKEIDD
jgi:uncharacterized protein (TIGR02466 family)